MSTAYSDIDLCYLTAGEAIAAFKAGTVSPVDVLRAQIARIEAVNPTLNALTYTYFDRAMDQAHEAEARYKNGGNLRPLEGVTCAIKDWHPMKGEITTWGSFAFENFLPDNTAPTVERLQEAGVIVHCRTTTPELGHSGITKSPLWGISRNAWNPEYSPGGSSGGAGAALAAGMTTIADGTDGGGSIRMPSSLSGIFGYKPPFGRNPVDREHPGETMLHYGPMARSVGDCALMQNVMSGKHPADLYSLADKVVLPEFYESIAGLKIALSVDLGYFEVDSEVRKNTLAAAETFRSLGCIVDEVELGWGNEVWKAWLTTWEGLFWSLCGDLLPEWREKMTPYVVKILEDGSKHDVKSFYAMHKVKYEMHQKLLAATAGYDVMIAPTLAFAPKADRKDDDPLIINGRTIENTYGGWMMTYPFNLLSQLPVMSVPSGFCSQTGVPTGLQIVGPTFDDLSVFRVASAFDAATRPWKSRRPTL